MPIVVPSCVMVIGTHLPVVPRSAVVSIPFSSGTSGPASGAGALAGTSGAIWSSSVKFVLI